MKEKSLVPSPSSQVGRLDQSGRVQGRNRAKAGTGTSTDGAKFRRLSGRLVSATCADRGTRGLSLCFLGAWDIRLWTRFFFYDFKNRPKSRADRAKARRLGTRMPIAATAAGPDRELRFVDGRLVSYQALPPVVAETLAGPRLQVEFPHNLGEQFRMLPINP